MRHEIAELFQRVIKPIEEKAARVRKEIESLKTFVIARPDESSIQELLHDLEGQMSLSGHASAGVGFLEKLAHVEDEIEGLQNRFHRQYSIDPREYIRSVAFSPDGELIAAGFMNGRVQVWQPDSGQAGYSSTVHLASVNSVAFSPDKFWLATGSRDRTIKLLEADTGAEVRRLSGHLGEVRSVSFSPDGQWLTSASHDKTVRLWRVATGGLVETFSGHTQQVTAAIFSPGGRTVASASWDRTVRLWDMSSERPARTLARHSHGVGAIAFAADGVLLASGDENGRVLLWDTTTGRMLKELRGHVNAINSLAFSPDGRVLASGCLGRSIILWAIDSGDMVKKVQYKNISYHSVAFSPRGEWLTLGSRGLELWLKALLTREEYSRVARHWSNQNVNKQEAEREARKEGQSIDTLWQDIRYGIRVLANHRHAAVAIVMLALGIGANSSIFSVVGAFVLKPLPAIPNGDKLVRLVEVEAMAPSRTTFRIRTFRLSRSGSRWT
jgi:WD40 repeat protein